MLVWKHLPMRFCIRQLSISIVKYMKQITYKRFNFSYAGARFKYKHLISKLCITIDKNISKVCMIYRYKNTEMQGGSTRLEPQDLRDGVQGSRVCHLWPHSKSWDSLGYLRPSLKKTTKVLQKKLIICTLKKLTMEKKRVLERLVSA